MSIPEYMPTLYNHTLYPLPEYRKHSPDKFEDYDRNGGRYASRVVAITLPGDVVQLDPDLKENYEWMVEHLGTVGIVHTTQVEWDTSPEVADNYPELPLSVYLFGSEAHAVRPNDRRYKAVGQFGDKNTFIEYSQEAGHPVPDTQTINNGEEPDYKAVRYHSMVKPAQSSGGKGLVEVFDEAQLKKAIAKAGSRFQIQDFVKGVVLSAQYMVVGGRAMHLATTEQIMNGHSHAGNRHPTRYDPRVVTDPLASELAAAGLEEIFGLDVVVGRGRGREPNYLLLENNPRFTGATYATIVAEEKLGVKKWASHTLETTLAGPEELDLGKTIYNPERQIGVVVMNNSRFDMGGLSKSTVEVLIAGPLAVQSRLKRKVQRILHEPANRKSISVPSKAEDIAA